MVERGFKKFPEFNAMLLDRYANREAGRTIADLYPTIIAWFIVQARLPQPTDARGSAG